MKESAVDPYILRADGYTHASDIRNVAFGYLDAEDTPDAGQRIVPEMDDAHVYPTERNVVLLTSSRDNTADLSYMPVRHDADADAAEGGQTGGDDIVPSSVFVGHEAFVNFSLLHKEGLSFLAPPPSSSSPSPPQASPTPYLVTGSNDNHVLVWSITPTRLEAVLDGHRSGVTCGDVIRVRGATTTTTTTPPPNNDSSSHPRSDLLEVGGYHGDIVTGDWAGSILIFSHTTGKVKASYNKHENAIRGLVHLPDTSLIASVSGDKTIHCWDFVRLAQEGLGSLALSGPVSRVLRGHEDVVQCVCYVGKTRGRGGDEEGGHTDSGGSRGSFLSYIATGSNDCTVRLWAVESNLKEAHPVKVLLGHDSLVYGVCFNTCSGELMSASEDRTVRVWGGVDPASGDAREATEKKEFQPPATIACDACFASFTTVHVVPHPCVVWSVAACRVQRASSEGPYEDLLLTGGADSVVRLWTRNDGNFASPDKLEALEAAIAAQKVDIKLLSEGKGRGGSSPLLDMQTMPSVEELHQIKGSSEGEKRFCKNEANEIEVYVWAGGRWDKIGVVVSENQPVNVSSTGQVINPPIGAGAAAGARREKRQYKGGYYDYVFDVDINGRMLQLPYNAGESVLEAAQNFINEHSVLSDFSEEASAAMAAGAGVSQEHKEQIVSFIMDNIDKADIRKIPGLGGGGGGGDASVPDESDGGASLLREDALWPTAELLESFSADGAQRKAMELLTQCAPDKAARFAGVMAELQQQLSSSTRTAAAAAVAGTMAEKLSELFAALPADRKFPAIDALRYAVAQAPQHAVGFLLALRPHLTSADTAASFVYAPSTDADALVLVRLLSNVLPALMTAQQQQQEQKQKQEDATTQAAASAALYARSFMEWALLTALPAVATTNAPRNGNVRQALTHFYLRNLSVLLRVVLSNGECVGAEGRQAFLAFRTNTGADETPQEEGRLLSILGKGFLRVLSPLLAAHAEDAPLLLRSAATAGVELTRSTPLPSPAAAFKADLAQALHAAPAGEGLAKSLH